MGDAFIAQLKSFQSIVQLKTETKPMEYQLISFLINYTLDLSQMNVMHNEIVKQFFFQETHWAEIVGSPNVGKPALKAESRGRQISSFAAITHNGTASKLEPAQHGLECWKRNSLNSFVEMNKRFSSIKLKHNK